MAVLSHAIRVNANRRRGSVVLAALVAAFGSAGPYTGGASAQLPIVSNRIADHRVAVTFGWDPVWVVRVGYSRALRDFVGDNDAALDFVITIPPVLVSGLHAWKVSAGVTALFVGGDNIGTTAGAHTGFAHSSDATGSKLAWQLSIVAQPGYYGDGWATFADAGWRTALATHMRHSDMVRDLFTGRYVEASPGDGDPAEEPRKGDRTTPPDDGPTDGWFAFAASRFRIGLAGGGGGTLAVFAAGGFEHTRQRQGLLASPQLGQLPFYGYAGALYRSDE